jgi:hypothetical protein
MKKIILTIAAVAALAGCNGLGTDQTPGTVAAREHDPAGWDWETKNGKSKLVYESEEFEITLKDGREFDLTDRAAFDRCTVGRTFDPKKGQC